MLLKQELGDLAGLDAVVVGRSNIVGKPMALLLLGESCTVTVAHSRTRDLPGVVRRADIVVAAVGRPEMVRGDWIKPGATVIDVGINRVERPTATGQLVGDVAFDEARRGRRRDHAGARRRRADDHRLPDPQHLRRRAPPRRPCTIRRAYDRCLASRRRRVADRRRCRARLRRDAQRIGQWTAFRKYADRDAVMFTPQAVWARDFLKDRKDPPKAISWRPAHSFVSCDGRTAVNTGPWFSAGRQARRLFHHRLAAHDGQLALGL